MKKTFDLLPDAVRPSLPWPRCKLRSIFGRKLHTVTTT